MWTEYTKIDTIAKRDLDGNKRLIDGTFRDQAIEYLQNVKFEATEKADGCLYAKTPILLADGTERKIIDIVMNDERPEIWGVDENGRPVITKVLAVHNNGISEGNWLNITLTNKAYRKSGAFRSVKCTDNHMFYVGNNEYKRADELKVGDSVYTFSEKHNLTYIQEQVLIGLMIGDGCLYNRAVAFSQKEEHAGYVEYLIGLLGKAGGTVSHGWASGYGTKMCRARSVSSAVIDELCQKFRVNGRNHIPKDVVVSPIALAVAYMDDGSLQHNDEQYDRCTFSLSDYDEESVDNFLWHLSKLGIGGSKQRHETKGFSVRLNASDSFAFQSLVCPYVCQCMQYKLSDEFKGQFVDLSNRECSSVENVVMKQTVSKIEPFNDKPHERYDLTTGTHNYIANGVVVHNCNVSIHWDGHVVSIHGRTGSAQLPADLMAMLSACFGGGATEQVFEQLFPTKSFYDDSGEQVASEVVTEATIYGEGIGPKIQKAGKLYGDQYRFLVFDIKVGNTYLEHSNPFYKQIIRAFGLEEVPTLPDMTPNEAIEFVKSKPRSWINANAPMEGVVLRPKVRLYGPDGSRLIVKVKAKDYEAYNPYAEKYRWVKKGKCVVYNHETNAPDSRVLTYEKHRCTIQVIGSASEKIEGEDTLMTLREVDTGTTYTGVRADEVEPYNRERWNDGK